MQKPYLHSLGNTGNVQKLLLICPSLVGYIKSQLSHAITEYGGHFVNMRHVSSCVQIRSAVRVQLCRSITQLALTELNSCNISNGSLQVALGKL